MDGAWGPWGNWEDCSKTCDGGLQSRTRFCDSPLPERGGSICTSSIPFLLSMTDNGTLLETDNQTCNNHNCPATTSTTTIPPKGKIIDFDFIYFPPLIIKVCNIHVITSKFRVTFL